MKRYTLASLALICLVSAASAHAATVSLGTAVNFAVLGTGVNDSQLINQTKMDIVGSEGISQGGSITISSTTSNVITGNIYEYTSGQVTLGAQAQLGGSIITSASTMTQADTDVATALSEIAGLTATQTINSNVTTNTTVNGNGGLNVIQINGNIVTSTGNSLTLSGTASDYFVVRVTGEADIQGAANNGLLLGGGVTASHVIYDFTGTANELGGSVADCASNAGFQVCTGRATTIDGTLLAPNLLMILDNNTFGEAISAQEIVLQSGGTLTGSGNTFTGFSSGPVTPEPASLLLLGSALCAMAGFRKRRAS